MSPDGFIWSMNGQATAATPPTAGGGGGDVDEVAPAGIVARAVVLGTALTVSATLSSPFASPAEPNARHV